MIIVRDKIHLEQLSIILANLVWKLQMSTIGIKTIFKQYKMSTLNLGTKRVKRKSTTAAKEIATQTKSGDC